VKYLSNGRSNNEDRLDCASRHVVKVHLGEKDYPTVILKWGRLKTSRQS
jgi:hypothetical protein